MSKKISLDFHDFSILNNRFDLLLQLKEHFPKLKVSMFTIPFDYENEKTGVHIYKDDFLKTLKENLDWIQLIPHGLSHIPREFEKCDRWTMKLSLEAIDEVFKKDGLPYVKGFCAPYWLWNQEVVDVLNEEGWWGAIDRNQPDMITPNNYYQYNSSIDEQFWIDPPENLKLHGHMSAPSTNGMEDCFLNLMKMPRDYEFVFVTEMLEKNK